MTDLSKRDDALKLARLFHENYEKLAPEYGYETRDETKDFDPSTANGQLMIATGAGVPHPQERKLLHEQIALTRKVLVELEGV